MVTYINNIPNGRKVLVGIRDEGSYELHPPAYVALQSIGLDPATIIDYRDGLAMIG